jgi:hypothetical protein
MTKICPKKREQILYSKISVKEAPRREKGSFLGIPPPWKMGENSELQSAAAAIIDCGLGRWGCSMFSQLGLKMAHNVIIFFKIADAVNKN